jgi:hypothetical protein
MSHTACAMLVDDRRSVAVVQRPMYCFARLSGAPGGRADPVGRPGSTRRPNGLCNGAALRNGARQAAMEGHDDEFDSGN